MTKAIALLSGGLDSTLAVRLMIDQEIDVLALNLVTPFCTCTHRGCRHQATQVAERFEVPVRVLSGGSEYIEMVRNPRFGYGSNMNPCIDCRILTFKKAREYMVEVGARFVFTGEVLGQRPMSQRLATMALIERESGLEGLVLRPLSARHLEPSIPEKMGWVDRERLLAIRGRSRRPQLELAEELGITDYPCPGGGCRLTDPNFARRIRDAFRHGETSIREIALLRIGRHFRFASGAKLVVGRNEGENSRLSAMAVKSDLLLEVADFTGPIALLRGSVEPADVELAASLCARYADCEENRSVDVAVKGLDAEERTVRVRSLSEGETPQTV